MLKYRHLPLLTALLLASCGERSVPTVTTPVPAPAQAPAGAVPRATAPLYEVKFQDIGGTRASSSAAPLGGTLAAQDVTDLNGSLTFKVIGVDTFVTGGVRHIRAVYRVTNTGTRTIGHLSFVPVDTDLDADPATTATVTPTTGSTFFKDLRSYGDTDASARAAALTATSGRVFSAVTGSAVPDPDATPYVSLDTSKLRPAVPTGLSVAGVAAQGWRLGTPLAPGESSNVTFAVDLQTDTPQTDPFTFSVVIAEGDDGNTAPGITPAATTTARLNLTSPGPAPVSGVMGDPTDPASVNGLDFTVQDAEQAPGELTVSVTSSNPAVATATVSGTGATRTIRITPQAPGTSDVTVTVGDGTLSSTYTVRYAASRASSVSGSRFHTGESNASSAVALDGDTMLVADDEFNALRVYPRGASGLPLASFDFSGLLNLPDAANPELDLEASARQGNRVYWLASHSNSKSGNARPNRSRLFATDLSGTGAATTLSFVGHFDHLKTDLLAWDSGNGHGLGPDALGLTASAATGVAPEAAGGTGFNIEGLAFAPGSSTAYLAFRAPNVPTSAHTRALIVPVTNFTSLVTGAAHATFGAPIQLDLGGRGIRELKCSTDGCLILAGPATGGPNFALYSWSGNPDDPARLRNDLTSLSADSDGSLESIVDLPGTDLSGPASDGQAVQLLSDNGDTVYSADGIIAKDQPTAWQKFRSDTVRLGSAQTCTVNTVTVTPSTSSVDLGGSVTFGASVDTTPAHCPVVVRWSSTNGNAAVNAVTGTATGVTAGQAGIVATASAGYGSAGVSSTPADLTVNGAADYTLTLGTPGTVTFGTGTGGSTTAPLTVNRVNGYAGTPTFTVSSSPAGVTGSVTGGTVTLGVPGTLPAGSYDVTVSGTDGALQRVSNTVTVTVATQVPNVTVYRVGSGAAALSNAATPVFLETRDGATGALVGTVNVPSTGPGALTASGTATSEGLVSTSADGHALLLTGYGAAAGTAGVAATTANSVPRVIGRLAADGTLDTSTRLTDAASSNNVRSAASTDGTTLYVTGGAGGVRATTLGSSTSTQLSTAAANLRQAAVFAGQLYVSSGSGTTLRIGTVGTGTPTTAGQTITNLPGFPASAGSPFGFLLADLSAAVPGPDTLYVADDGAGLQKYSLEAGSWTAKGTVGGSGDFFRGLTGTVTGGTVNLYATSASRLVTLSDTSGYGGTLTGSPVTLATAPTNTAYRGVTISPR